jgi:stearoyl-CoA desaturase (delta-9 desaturase)
MPDDSLIAGPETRVVPALLRREPDGVRRIDWSYAGGVAALHLLALLALLPWFFSWTGLLLVPIGMYTFGTLGINVGLHRLLTHRSFVCPRWLERSLVLLGTCGFMDSPAYWVAVHRRHHQFADEERDPHSPIESFFWSQLGWYMGKVDRERRAELVQRYAKDVLRDPLYACLERGGNWLLPIAVSWLVFFAVGWAAALAAGAGMAEAIQFGASVLVWGAFVRGVVVFHITMSVNSCTHLWGYRSYRTDDNSRNNVLIGILAAGEGWHNNHHADPRAARHGRQWWELDIAWLLIRLLERVGLAHDIVRPSAPLAATDRP